MMDRNEMVSKIIELAKSQVGAAYVWGTWGGKCTPAYRKQYANYTPAKKDLIYSTCPSLSGGMTCEGCRYQGKRAFDCRGLTRWVLKEAGVISLTGQGADSQWRTSSNWGAKGTIDKMPDLAGLVLFRSDNGRMGHTGIYIGENSCIHAKGHTSGVVMSGMAGIRWTHWACPKGLYDIGEEQDMTMKRGARGEDVKALQTMLARIGRDVGAIDGIYGAKTEDAVIAFQRANGLNPDGIAGNKTMDKLKSAVAGLDAGQEEAAEIDFKKELCEIKARIDGLDERLSKLEGRDDDGDAGGA